MTLAVSSTVVTTLRGLPELLWRPLGGSAGDRNRIGLQCRHCLGLRPQRRVCCLPGGVHHPCRHAGGPDFSWVSSAATSTTCAELRKHRRSSRIKGPSHLSVRKRLGRGSIDTSLTPRTSYTDQPPLKITSRHSFERWHLCL